MSAEVAEAIRQTRRTLAEKTWVPYEPHRDRGEVCVVTAAPSVSDVRGDVWKILRHFVGAECLSDWNDRQTDVGAVLGMTLQALIAELCKPTLAQPAAEA